MTNTINLDFSKVLIFNKLLKLKKMLKYYVSEGIIDFIKVLKVFTVIYSAYLLNFQYMPGPVPGTGDRT